MSAPILLRSDTLHLFYSDKHRELGIPLYCMYKIRKAFLLLLFNYARHMKNTNSDHTQTSRLYEKSFVIFLKKGKL